MKKTFTLFFLFFSVFVFAQKTIMITQNKRIPKNGFYLKLNTVFDDSRCPEGVTCVWAGAVSAIVEVYKNKKIVEKKTIVFNSKNTTENYKWFANYYSKKIRSITVLPLRKEGQKIVPKKQSIKVEFAD